MTKALIIEPGAWRVDDIDAHIGVLQGIIGGFIEGVRVPDFAAHAYVNEDGRRLELPSNYAASALTRTTIVGTAIVFGNYAIPDEDDVPDVVVAWMRTNFPTEEVTA